MLESVAYSSGLKMTKLREKHFIDKKFGFSEEEREERLQEFNGNRFDAVFSLKLTHLEFERCNIEWDEEV